jgi:hypothetical protein
MPRLTTLATLALLAGCAAEETPEPEPLHTPTLADFAGSWNMTVIFPEQGDTVRSTLSGTEAANDWVMVNPGDRRVRMPTVSLKGDSMILVSDKFPAVVRPGATAQVRTAAVLREGVMEGKILATFELTDGSQEVRAGTLRAERQP